MASVYLLIKVHKHNFPGRAVVSQIDDPTYKMWKVLTDILNPLDESSASFVKDSFHMKELLSEVQILDHHILASFDVTALYPSIPIERALQVLRESLTNDANLNGRTDWSVDDIMELVQICLETHFKTFEGRIYTQTDGTPIGKSISGPIAGIYMDWFERTYIFNAHNHMPYDIPKPCFWKRMRDDIFIIWDHSERELDRLFWYLNGIEPKIQFTIEKEKEGSLPFLDIHIHRLPNSLITKVYRKPTHTQRYIHWRSNHPKNCLLGVLKGLIHRAHKLCDLKEDLLEELQLLRDVFVSNGYPVVLVEKTLKLSWEIEIRKQFESAQVDPDQLKQREYFDVLHAPYVRGFSENLQRKLKRVNVGYVFKRGDTIQNHLVQRKIPIQKEEKKNVIYAIGCKSCNFYYVGETSQHFATRRSQHQADVRNKNPKNGIYQHLKAHREHQIDWDKVSYLDNEGNWRARKISESFFINAIDPTNKLTMLMNLEKGREVDPCWMVFNSELRKIASKKLNSPL
jgi:hypothetical protein